MSSLVAQRRDGQRSLTRAHGRDQRARFWCGFGLVLLGQACGECLEDLERTRAIALAVEQHDEAPHQSFVVRRKLDRAPGPAHRALEIATRFALVDQQPRRARCRRLQPCAFGIQPTLELGGVADAESVEQRSAVEIQCVECAGDTRAASRVECRDVDRHVSKIQSHLVIAAACQGFGAEGDAQNAQRLAQRCARVLLIELGPEQRQQAVEVGSATGALRVRQHQ